MPTTAVAEAVESGTSETIKKKLKAYVTKVEEQIAEIIGDFGPRCWRLGLLIVEIQEKQFWAVRNFESETKYREYLKVGRSTWFRTGRLTKECALPLMNKELITRKQLDRLTLENAEHWLKLDDRRRFNQAWVTKALTMSESEFEAQVDHAMNNDSEPEEGLGQPESQCTIKWKCTTSQKQVIEETIWDFCKRQELPLDAEPQALVLMLADYKAGWPEVGKLID